MVDPQTWNGYAYVNNSPLRYTDPSGEGFWSGLGRIVGTIAGGFLFGGLGGATGVGNLPNIGGVNDGPWNERLPVSVGSGPAVNLGGVYGGGSTSPFVFSILRADAALGSQNYKFYVEAIAFLMTDPKAAAAIFQLQQSRSTWIVRFNRGGGDDAARGIVNWDPLHSLYTTNGGCLSPATILAHELGHAALEDSNPSRQRALLGMFDRRYDNLEERRVITGVETSVQRMLGGRPRVDHRADETKGIRGWEPGTVFSPVLANCR